MIASVLSKKIAAGRPNRDIIAIGVVWPRD